jgi:excisionase family DNA binding protein
VTTLFISPFIIELDRPLVPYLGPSPDDDLLRPREVAEIFGVRTTTIARWARDGILTALATPGGHRRYRRTEINAILMSVDSSDTQRYEQDAVRLYAQGWSIRRVAEEFGVSYGAMRRLLLKNTKLRDHRGRTDEFGAP